MTNLIAGLFILVGLFGGFASILLIALLRVVNRVAEVNRQLIILVAGQNEKPEALRALIASAKPPQGKLRGIAGGDKKTKTENPANTNYTMSIGI